MWHTLANAQQNLSVIRTRALIARLTTLPSRIGLFLAGPQGL